MYIFIHIHMHIYIYINRHICIYIYILDTYICIYTIYKKRGEGVAVAEA